MFYFLNKFTSFQYTFSSCNRLRSICTTFDGGLIEGEYQTLQWLLNSQESSKEHCSLRNGSRGSAFDFRQRHFFLCNNQKYYLDQKHIKYPKQLVLDRSLTSTPKKNLVILVFVAGKMAAAPMSSCSFLWSYKLYLLLLGDSKTWCWRRIDLFQSEWKLHTRQSISYIPSLFFLDDVSLLPSMELFNVFILCWRNDRFLDFSKCHQPGRWIAKT